MTSHARSLLVVAALVGLLGASAPQVAHADPAGPTDYRSAVVAITPATDAIEVSIEGGDSFVRIEVQPDHEAVVLGYSGEPYLRILPDGTVERNRRSMATYYNEDRYGRTDIPDIVDNDAPPDWEAVGGGGTWAWHDHRAHWMGTTPSLGLDPGESLPLQDVLLVVDGTPVTVQVQITLQDGPSAAPVVFGAVIGLAVALLASLLGPATTALAMLLVAIGALVVGTGQYTSLPAETGRALTWWLLPALAVVCIIVAMVTYGVSRLMLLGLTVLAAVQVGLWAFRRRAGLSKPVLPTDLPAGFDRFVTAAALTSSVVAIAVGLREMFRSPVAEPG